MWKTTHRLMAGQVNQKSQPNDKNALISVPYRSPNTQILNYCIYHLSRQHLADIAICVNSDRLDI